MQTADAPESNERAPGATVNPRNLGHPGEAAADLVPIRTLLARIQGKYHPEQIWLFGSRARGDARPASDWDLLVVVPDSTDEGDLDPLTAWRLQKGSGVHADVIPCKASENSTPTRG